MGSLSIKTYLIAWTVMFWISIIGSIGAVVNALWLKTVPNERILFLFTSNSTSISLIMLLIIGYLSYQIKTILREEYKKERRRKWKQMKNKK